MRIIHYLLFFLSSPIRHKDRAIIDHKFIESPTESFNDFKISPIYHHNPITRTFSTQNDYNIPNNEEAGHKTSGDTPISDLYTIPNIDLHDIDPNTDTDSESQDSDFIPDLDDSDTIDSKDIAPKNLPSNKTQPINKPSSDNKRIRRNLFGKPGRGIFSSQEKYIIQNKLPRLFGDHMRYKSPESQEEFNVERRQPKKLLESTRPQSYPSEDLDNIPKLGDIESDLAVDYTKSTISRQSTLRDIQSVHGIISPDFDHLNTNKDEFISKSSTWDIPTSQIRVKGAYFIQRYVQELREPFKKHEKDISSPEFQIASLTARIDYLIQHIKKSPKDVSAKIKLLKLAHRRRKHLIHLFKSDKESLQKILDTFNLHFDPRPYTYEKVLPDYVYRKRKSTKRTYTNEGRSGPFVISYARFDNITLDSLIK